MYQVLKKYRRRLMAFFAAGLMVAFLVPTMSGRGQTRGNTAAGTIDGKTVYVTDLVNSQYEWEALKRNLIIGPEGYGMRPLAALFGPAAQQIEEHRDLYMLLQKEAAGMGMFVSRDRVDELLKQVRVVGIDMRGLDNVEFVKRSLANFLMVQDAFGHAADAIKISQPYRSYELATRFQQVKVNAVDFAAADFAGKLPDPTKEQLQEQYDKWVEVDRETADPSTNPFGFGYRFPSRAKLQYLCIPATELRKAVEARQSPERWEVDARKYYLVNQAAFSATTQETSATGPTTRRITKPFEEVRKDVMEAMVKPEVEKLQGEVYRYVSGVLSADWTAFQTSTGATQPSSMGAAYQSYDYLQKLAKDVQAKFNVALTIEQWSDYLSQRDLETKGGIGMSRTIAQISMPRYAMLDPKADKAVVEREQRRSPGLPKALELWQPSQMLRDEANNVYVFRVTASDSARKPTGLDEVKQQVEKDWRLAQSMKLAREAADAFLAAAKEKGFATTVQASKKVFLTSDYFNRTSQVIMGLHLVDDAAVGRFVSEAATLLAMKTKDDPKPLAVLALPRDARVFVAQLEDVRSQLTSDIVPMASQAMGEQLVRELQNLFSTQWYDYQNVVKRVKYVPAMSEGDALPPPDENSPANFPSL